MANQDHGFLETILHGGLSLWNMWDQGKALLATGTIDEKKEINKQAALVFAAKTLEELVTHRITGREAIAKGVNDIVDLKLTNLLEEKGVPAIFAKAIGLFASHLAEKLVLGVTKGMISPKATLDEGTQQLVRNGQINPNKPDSDVIDKFKNMMSGGETVHEAGTPLGSGLNAGKIISALMG
jgi:hypothetical protein